MNKSMRSAGLLLAVLLGGMGMAWTQGLQPSGTLVVNGQPGQVPVIQINGRAYVDVEALARLLNGSLSFDGNQVSLTLPPSPAGAPAAQSQVPPVASDFSKEFLRAAIEEMTVIREWRSALLGAVQNGYPVSEEWMTGYQGQASAALKLAFVAASTDADRNAFQFLRSVFDKMTKLSDQVVSARKNMNYLAPDALENDPLNRQILSCARSLTAMAAAGTFQDDGSCH